MLRWLGDEIGRLARLKILCAQARVGSSPTRATILICLIGYPYENRFYLTDYWKHPPYKN